MISEASALLQQYLGQLSGRGITHVPLSESARELLRRGPVTAAAGDLAQRPVGAPTATPAMPATSPEETAAKKERLSALAEQARDSDECRALGTLRGVMVFATGSPDAELMFIGEAPGAEEERRGEPFVGPAGETLTKIIQAMGFKRSEVYISNICKYRPAIPGGPQASKNRPPSPEEMQTCLPFITSEISIIQPRVIVALGATACNGLGIEGTVGRLRGRFHEFAGIPVMVTYHPSYLLRSETNADKGVKEKRLVWEDMLQVMERLRRPITTKQRAYFTQAAG